MYGGGCSKALMVCAILKKTGEIINSEAIAMEAFVKALFQLPTNIPDNSCYSSFQLVAGLLLNTWRGRTLGLNMHAGRVECAKMLGIIESFAVKRQTLLSVPEAAEVILLVDNIVKAASRKRIKDRG